MHVKLTQKAINILERVIVWLLYALLFTPMLLSSRFFFPYINTKTFYFRLLVEVAVFLYAILAVADRAYRLRRHPLLLVVVVFLGIVVMTGLLGFNPYRSFWGNAERGEGILTLAHVIALFFVMVGVLRRREQWTRFFWWAVGISFVSALYATVQKLCGTDPGPICSRFIYTDQSEWFRFIYIGDVTRLSALIGNAAFYAGYLLMNLFLAFWLFLQTHKTWQRVVLGVVMLYELFILNLTRTRGALLALVVAFFVGMVLLLLSSDRGRLRRAAGIALVGFVAVLGMLYALRDTAFIRTYGGGISSITHIGSDDVTKESRLLTWQAAWRGWNDRFWLGYGYENFAIAFNKYFPAKIYRDAGSQIWFDRAHNAFFELAVTTGVLGIVAYLSVFGLSFWLLFRYWQRDRLQHRATAIVLATLLVAYLLQNFFVFDTLGTYMLFFAVLAFIIFLTQQPQPTPEAGKSAHAVSIVSMLCLLIGLAYVSSIAVFKPAKANIMLSDALLSATQQRDMERAVATYQRVIALGTYMNEEARQKMAESVLALRDAGDSTPAQKQKHNRAFREAIEELKLAIAANPHDPRNYMFLMSLYNNLPVPEVGSYDEAIRVGQQALSLSPTRPQIYFELGQAAVSLGGMRVAEGIEYFRKAVELNPVPVESRWNLALALSLAGRAGEAEREVDYIYRQERISKISDMNIRNLIQFYSAQSLPQYTVRLYQTLLERHPEDAALHAQLANAYGSLCQLDKAREEALLTVRYKPEVATEVEAFIVKLLEACRKK